MSERFVHLGDFVDLLTGFPFKSTEYTEGDGNPKLLRGDNIAQGLARWDNVKRWPVARASEVQQYELESGDVVLAMDRPWIEAGLKFARISDADLPALLVQRVSRMRALPGLHPRLLYYVIASKQFTDYVQAVQTGTTVPHISAQQIKDYEFRLPSDDEQTSVATILGALDDKIELNRRMNETLEAMARAIFKDWFVDFGPTRAKAEGRAPYLAPELWDLFPDTLDEEGKPVGWYQSSLGNDLSVLETGKRPRGGVAGISEGIPSVGAESIVKVGEFVFSKTKYVPRDFFSKMSKGHVSDGDVLIYKDGGKPGELHPAVTYVSNGFPFAEFCINEHVFRIRIESLSQPLLYCLLSTDDAFWQMRELATGVAQPGLNQAAIKSIKFIIPDDQRLLRGAEAVIDPLIDRCNDNSLNSRTLAQTRDLLLPKLMSDEIRLREAEKTVEAVA